MSDSAAPPDDNSLVERQVQRIVREMDLRCEIGDLRAWGHQGLLEARARFDESRGARFSTFAYYRIRGAIIDGIRKQGWVSRRAYAKMKAAEATDRLAEPLGESLAHAGSPAPDARAKAIGDALGSITAAYVLAAIGQDEDAARDTPEDLLGGAQQRQQVGRLLEQLPEREQVLLRAVYFEDQTIEQAGARLGLSKSWASRLHAKGLSRLRELMREGEPGA